MLLGNRGACVPVQPELPFPLVDINKDLIFMVALTNTGCAGGLLETRDGVAGANVIVR